MHMACVELVQVNLEAGKQYQYGLGYTHAKTTLKHQYLSSILTPWTTMNRLYPFSTRNKENRPLSPPPLCVEIVLIKNVFEQTESDDMDFLNETSDDQAETADHSEILTLWRASEKGHYNPTIQHTQRQPEEEILAREYPWLFQKYSPGPHLSDSDSLEIRTIKPPPPRPVQAALQELRRI